ncbi:MAG: nicotinamide riboside transporter PnuC [Nanoarchaeota archaeon]|nr:nicotinamide riboside transporter PnuC [Nanoarchaeota archaeon]MCG2717792.1 nicotinamide riboside transporter PnuC [Nanoarchaeota archaeon]
MLKHLKNYFKDWNLFEKSWLLIFSIINIYLFFAWSDTLIGLTASLTGMICVVLVAKGKISNYYFGIINVILYAYIAYQSKYYGEVMLNGFYFLPMQFIGLYYWKKHRNKNKSKDDVKIKLLSFTQRFGWLTISVLGVFFYGLFLKYLGGTLPFVDSTSTILSVIAMILMVKRVLEQWILWIAIDVVSIYMWFYILTQGGNEISMLIMWSAYLVNAVYGFYNWSKMAKNDHRK